MSLTCSFPCDICNKNLPIGPGDAQFISIKLY